MNELVYRNFYERCGSLNGWDFSKVRSASEGAKWDFYHEVSQRCKKSDILLDIGTGGGEALLSITEAALLLVGIDSSVGMLEAANANLKSSRISNVRILQMDADKLDFPHEFFNVVSSRHAPINSEEVARVLVDDGIFLTQQVSEDDKINIKNAFGRGQSFGIQDGTLKNNYITELREAGFHNIQAFDCDATEWYQSYEDLIFLLKHTPIIPNFGQSENDFAILDKFIGEHKTKKGIMTNSKRFMIIARK
ncbi:class I SAM-dependent methyltransferase [Paenibacillus arenilitoris]|uniref:Class I SAM-dependent methyltransferase n=1 Tax=Paenibacillus arenilitoris TaxID=2772299 RepID=A0A927H776_9BACL|nr:class I SAM-dependent methyltransferase [Paenibacillus arenilitoris]MBD2870363.1 class I SAM-dependent methyltransferase [Paenibacillus arenilitoris]